MKKIIAVYILLFIVILTSCQNRSITFTSGNDFMLDTFVSIKIYHYADETIDETLISEAFTYMKELENKLSVHITDSDIDLINKNAGIKYVTVSKETYDLLVLSIYYCELSNGLFDVTAGPLIDLWDIHYPNGYLPSQEELDNVLPLVDYNNILFKDDNQVMLKLEGMTLNLGGIAKGYIADCAKEFLVNNGVKSALLNLGGNILLIGDKPDGSDFTIGIRDPDSNATDYLLTYSKVDCAVVSSGTYERYFIEDGIKYHHILNPITGFPADTNIKQVSIIATDSTSTDALSTSVILLGLEKGLELINSIDNTECIIILNDDSIYFSNNIS